MLLNIKNNFKNKYKGFTLVEILIAVAITGIISIISIQGLFDIISIRAKQQSIEESSENFRIIIRALSKAATESINIDIPNINEIRITGEKECQTIKYNSVNKSLEKALVSQNPCIPPDSNFQTITNSEITITKFSLSPIGQNVKLILLEVEGYYKNSLGDHPIKYTTTITKRI